MTNSEVLALSEKLIEQLETCANFCRGMSLDPAIPKHAKEALLVIVRQTDAVCEQAMTELGIR